MGNTFFIKQGDSSPELVYRLSESINLTGATALFSMTPITAPEADSIVRESATIGAENKLSYTFDEGRTQVAGVFRAEFEITYADSSIETFPNTGYITVKIMRGL